MFAKLFTACLVGLRTQLIEVEVDYRQGLNHFVIVGLADKAVQEAKERIVSAIRNSGADYTPKRVIVNLAPADMQKSGPQFDLAIAVAFLLATEQVKFATSGKLFLGELALDGKLRPVSGVLPLVDGARHQGFTEIFLPAENAAEASLVDGVTIYPSSTLVDVIHHFAGLLPISVYKRDTQNRDEPPKYKYDLAQVYGQAVAKRGLEIVAAGGHNLLLRGVPGAGKSLLAKCLPSILPDLTLAESLEVTRIHSLVGGVSKDSPLVKQRPFRSPHHTSSPVAMIGGGSTPRPGEISLAHLGVLFLDEFPEFPLPTLEALRQPLEDGVVTVSRATLAATFPARFRLVAAMNPCKCGYFGSVEKACSCTTLEVQKYQRRISGPILDRIDLVVNVSKVANSELLHRIAAEPSNTVKQRVQAACDFARPRLTAVGINSNSEMTVEHINHAVELDRECRRVLQLAQTRFNLSARGYYRVLKVARTIADLAQCKLVTASHIAEALSFRIEN